MTRRVNLSLNTLSAPVPGRYSKCGNWEEKISLQPRFKEQRGLQRLETYESQTSARVSYLYTSMISLDLFVSNKPEAQMQRHTWKRGYDLVCRGIGRIE